MNNYYGYISNCSNPKNNLVPEESVGLWTSKKNRQKIEKEAHLLQNRVNLLQQEENRIEKKIFETKKKMLEYIERKRKDCQEFSEKMKKKENDEQKLSEKRRMIYSSKRGGEELRKSIGYEINKIKRAETVEIRKIREMSKNKIKEYRDNLFNSKQEQYMRVKSSENLMKRNIQQYWDNKKNYHNNLHKSMKMENEQVFCFKEKEIFKLEKAEENLIQKLEKSQNFDEIVVRQLEDVMVTPLEEFIDKYGEEKKEKKIIKSKESSKFSGNKRFGKAISEKDLHSSPKIRILNANESKDQNEENIDNFFMS